MGSSVDSRALSLQARHTDTGSPLEGGVLNTHFELGEALERQAEGLRLKRGPQSQAHNELIEAAAILRARSALAPVQRETIIAAAIRIPVEESWRKKVWLGKRSYPDHLTITAPPPARHATLMHPFGEYTPYVPALSDQGFITSTGRFVEREEALQIAIASGQPMIDHPSRHARLLFSEDLW